LVDLAKEGGDVSQGKKYKTETRWALVPRKHTKQREREEQAGVLRGIKKRAQTDALENGATAQIGSTTKVKKGRGKDAGQGKKVYKPSARIGEFLKSAVTLGSKRHDKKKKERASES